MTVDDNQKASGEQGARRLIELGMPCTAIVAGTDRNAIGALEVLDVAGYQVPADLAVVGFDDLNLAQFSNPPLTTIRTRFDELGYRAAQLLFDQIDGAAIAPGSHYVPTTLVCRRSCGCDPTANLHTLTAAPLPSADWQVELASQLVHLALFPVTPDPATPSTQIWPGVVTLIPRSNLARGRQVASEARAWLVAVVPQRGAHVGWPHSASGPSPLALVSRHMTIPGCEAPDPVEEQMQPVPRRQAFDSALRCCRTA